MRVLGVLLLTTVLATAQHGPSLVEVAPVESKIITSTRAFVGSVEAMKTSDVSGEIAGRVVQFLARQGQRVAADQPLAVLRSTNIDIRLRAARAEWQLRKAELLELENGARPEELQQARARFGQAEAAFDVQAWKLANARKLVASSTISADALRDAELASRVAEQMLLESKASLALVDAGPRAERKAQAQARVDAQQAEVDRLVDLQERHTILAPFAGYVLEEFTEKGQWLKEGDPVARIAALDEVDVVVPVLEDSVGAVQIGDTVAILFDALGAREFSGKVQAIVPQADRRARTFPVKLRLANPKQGDQPTLRIGMFARIQLPVGPKTKALLIPKDALVLGGPAPTVYVFDPKTNTVQPVPVATGRAMDDRIEIVKGLALGQQVVTKGNERLRPGQPVQLAK